MNIKDILLIVIIIYLIITHCKRNNREHFAVTDDIRAAVKEIYNTDMEAIRQLAVMAQELTAGGMKIPGNLTVSGTINGTLNGNASTATNATNAGYANSAGSASSAGSAGSASSAGTAGSAGHVTNGIHDSGGWRLYNNGGMIGIGTTSPAFPLHVENPQGTTAWTGAMRFDGSGILETSGNNRQVCAGFYGGYVSANIGYIFFSDQRIKSNIINVDIQSNLELFRKIRPVKYGYIDKLEYGSVHKYGFIAQEVQQILPDAVIKGTQIIPSVYCNANIVNTQNNFILSFDKPLKDIKQFSIGTKLKCYDDKNEIVWVIIKAIIDTQNIEIEEKITNEGLFVYGHSVDDFLQIDHETIWTVTTSAVQEIDRQQQDDQIRITKLESIVANQEIKIANQEIIINNILERLNELKI